MSDIGRIWCSLGRLIECRLVERGLIGRPSVPDRLGRRPRTRFVPRVDELEGRLTPAATHLSFVGVASSVLNESPFAVTVQAVDQYGAVDTSFSGTVTLGVNSGPSSIAGGGLSPTMFSAGVATVTGITLTGVGSTALSANSSGSTPLQGTSSAILVKDNLVFTAVPAHVLSANGGNPAGAFGLTVTAEKFDGSTDANYPGADQVTLTINSGPTGAVFGGSLTLSPVNGVAAYTGLMLDHFGNYTLHAATAQTREIAGNSSPIQVGANHFVLSPLTTVTAGG